MMEIKVWLVATSKSLLLATQNVYRGDGVSDYYYVQYLSGTSILAGPNIPVVCSTSIDHTLIALILQNETPHQY